PIVTNVYLSHVRCLRKDWIVAVGDRGVVVESDGTKWWMSRIPGADELTLSNVELFQGRLYVAAVEKLFARGKQDWQEVRHPLHEEKTRFVKLLLGEDKLWAMGFKRLNSFDGTTWLAHPDPNNG